MNGGYHSKLRLSSCPDSLITSDYAHRYTCICCAENSGDSDSDGPSFTTELAVLEHYRLSHHKQDCLFHCRISPTQRSTLTSSRNALGILFTNGSHQSPFAHSQKYLGCPLCWSTDRRQFPTLDSLESHLAYAHFGCALFTCDKCSSRPFATEQRMWAHKELAHNDFGEHTYHFTLTDHTKTSRQQILEYLNAAIKQSNVPAKEVNGHSAWLEKVLPYVLYEWVPQNGLNQPWVKSSVVVVGPKVAATYQHKMHKKLRSDGRHFMDVYYESTDTPIHCKVAFVEENSDYIMLESLGDVEFSSLTQMCWPPPTILRPALTGEEYICIGYGLELTSADKKCPPNQMTSMNGSIERSIPSPLGHIIGKPAKEKGYSGAGCFGRDGKLLGIVVKCLMSEVNIQNMKRCRIGTLIVGADELARGYKCVVCPLRTDNAMDL